MKKLTYELLLMGNVLRQSRGVGLECVVNMFL